MKNKKGLKLIKKAIGATLILSSLATFCGCAKEVDCSINGDHVHLYLNENTKLSAFIESEKEYIGDLFRTETYLPMTENLNIISENDLYIVQDNLEYLNKELSKYVPSRQAYVYDYIYGTYYGFGHGYNMMSGEYEYFYGMQTGWHYDYEWQDISLDEHTEDKVRDITYQFRFYKINNDGTVSSSLFNSLEEVSEEYKYFKPNVLVQKNISDSYYLTKEKIR